MTIKKMKTLIFSALIAVAPVGMLFGQSVSKVGTTAGQFLEIPVGARYSAMGGAVAATVNDVSAMYWNPAGLADIEKNEFMLEYGDWFLDVNHNYFGVAIPAGKGVAGLHVNSLTMGDFEETTYDQPEGTGRMFNSYMLSVGASYAAYIFPKFRIGGTVKFIQENIYNTTANGVGFDVGTLYELPFYGIRFGVSVTNFGSKMRLDGDGLIVPVDVDPNNSGNRPADAKLYTDEFDIPLTLKVGFAWDAVNNEQLRATLSVDGNSPSDNYQSVSVGGEIALLNEMVFLRAGAPYLGLKDRTQNINAGVGFNYSYSGIGIRFSYAYESYDYFQQVNRISLQVLF